MKFFKFDWFSSKEKRELEELRKAEVERLKRVNEDLERTVTALSTNSRPYKNMYYSNGVVTLVTNSGDVLTKTDVDQSIVDRIKNCYSESAVLDIFTEIVIKPNNVLGTEDEKHIVKSSLGIFDGHEEFILEGENVYLKGVSLAIPTIIVASFIEILEKIDVYTWNMSSYEVKELEEQFEALKMFWLKLALNGIEQSRLDLLNFCRKNDVKITRNGNLVLYRRIVNFGSQNKKLLEFVSQEYFKIKAKKDIPLDYFVTLENGNYVLNNLNKVNVGDFNREDVIGNLLYLYTELPNMTENQYTSWHARGEQTIKIGSIYKIDEDRINLNNGLCAAGGLHAAAVDYNYSGFGDTPVVVLVNPSKAITVPVNETGKLRTTEMFIACINDKPLGIHFDEGALSAFDEEYNNLTIKELEDAISKKSFAPASVEDQISPITFLDMEGIKNLLKGRVKTI